MHSAALIVRTEDGQPGGRIRRLQHERPVGTVAVVLDVDPKDPLQVATANDQEPVEALGADRPDPALCVRARLGCLYRRHKHLAAL
jgi:hypothetical protein